MSIFLKPWHYEQTLLFLLHHGESLSFPATQAISEAQKPLGHSPSGAVVSASRCLPPGFRGPVGRAFPGWRLVQTHRNASSPGRERQLSPTPQPRTGSSQRHPFPLLPSVLEQTPDLPHRALGGRERKALETGDRARNSPSTLLPCGSKLLLREGAGM